MVAQATDAGASCAGVSAAHGSALSSRHSPGGPTSALGRNEIKGMIIRKEKVKTDICDD